MAEDGDMNAEVVGSTGEDVGAIGCGDGFTEFA